MKPMMKTEAVFHFYVNINDKIFKVWLYTERNLQSDEDVSSLAGWTTAAQSHNRCNLSAKKLRYHKLIILCVYVYADSSPVVRQ